MAAYSLDNPDNRLRTAASIATSADVQPFDARALAQHFGFEGFSSLQQIFRARLRERTPGYEERLKALRQNDHSKLESGSIIQRLRCGPPSLARQHRRPRSIRGIRARRRHSRQGEHDLSHRQARSYPISSYMAYAFGKLKVKYQHVGTAAGIDEDMLAMATKEDAAFAVSFSPYASESAKPGALARQPQGTRCLADRLRLLALAESSRVWFETGRGDHAASVRSPQHGLRHGADRRHRRERRRLAEGE
ncbi:SIS domain-containing protein [Sinorhizobium meliloti]|nr:SIS domain-containing protein [Sinorhizobium meliloti]